MRVCRPCPKRIGPSIVALALIASSCSDGSSGTDLQGLRAATYNGGLAVSFVDFAPARAPVVIDALAAEPFDLLCVQEFWRDEDWEGLVASAASTLPHTFRRPSEPDPDGGGGCPAELSDPLEACARARCDVPVDQLTNCVLSQCGPELDRIALEDPACFGCLAANVGKSIDEILDTCGPDSSGGGSFAFGGSFGTGILSKAPLVETDSLLLEATTNRRALLYARIDDTPIGPVHAFCTHLTANLQNVPYTGPFGSWAAEQAMQIDRLIAWVDEKATSPGTVVFLGDFNTGPSLGIVRAELPENYAKLVAAGFANPYVAQRDAECSFCDDNPLVGGSGDGGVLIDHVLLRGHDGPTAGRQFLRGEIDVVAEAGPVTTAYSDHYGVSLTIAPPR